jgi:nitrogen fixation NifU-like protein
MDLYTEQILDLAKHPLNRRVIEKATHTHSGVNLTCGDHVRIYLKIENGIVAEASWEGEGCAISLASASVLTEEIRGKKVSEVGALEKEDLLGFLEINQLGPARIKCVSLCLETLKGALQSNL